MTTELHELDVIVTETNAVAISDPLKDTLVAELKPIADKLHLYQQEAEDMQVKCKDDAEDCAIKEAEIQRALKQIKDNDTLTKITDGLHKLHRRWTTFRGVFTISLEDSKKTFRTKRIEWEDEQRRLAEAERQRLQALEDARIAKERAKAEEAARIQREKEIEALRVAQEALRKAQEEQNAEARSRLEAEAEKARKQAEVAAAKAQAKEEQAEAKVATQIRVEAPISAGRSRVVWKVESIDQDKFYQAVIANPMLRGYIEIKTTALERTKASNPIMEIPGVVFKQVRS